MDILFIFNSILLGVGLAMDAFSVSIANGIQETHMKLSRMIMIAGTYAFFQFMMPVIGWFCVHTLVYYFRVVEPYIPIIAFFLLLYIGISMIRDTDEHISQELTVSVLLIQAIATSIDALSVGFTISEYTFTLAIICGLIIAIVTFIICMSGLKLGKIVGNKLSNKANILGGSILIFIGIEILVKSLI